MKNDLTQAQGRFSEGGLFVPEGSAQEWGIALTLSALSALYLWPFRDVTQLFIDEGIVLQGAQRILHGEVLYRDYFTFVTPGSYYWIALVLKLFGSSFVAARTLLAIYGGVFSLLTYLLARRVCSRWAAILVVYLFLVIGLPYQFLIVRNWDSSVLAYFALYCGVRLLEKPGPAWALATGALASLTCLFEQSKGAGLVMGLALGFGLVDLTRRSQRIWSRPRLAALVAGFSAPFVITFLYFASQSAVPQMISDWLWPLSHYSGANRVPYGTVSLTPQTAVAFYATGSWFRRLFYVLLTSPFFLLPVLPFVALGLLILSVRRLKKEDEPRPVSAYYVLVSSVSMGLVASVVMSSRPDFDHMLYIAPPLLLILGWILGGRIVNSRLLMQARPLLAICLLVLFSAFGMIPLLRGPVSAKYRLETRRGIIELPEPDGVIPYLQGRVEPGQKIFVYPYQPLYYFLTGTYSPTETDYLQMGMHTPEQFNRALATLAAAPPDLVVWDLPFNSETILNGWPATPLEKLTHDPIRDFILERYRMCTVVGSITGRFVILVRDDLSCEPHLSPRGQWSDRAWEASTRGEGLNRTPR